MPIVSAVSADQSPSLEAGRPASPGSSPAKIAVLCAHPRLRTILRLSLLADDHEVVEWQPPCFPVDPGVGAVVIDLDSLGHDVPSVLELLGTWGIGESTPLLFISVYPLDLRSLPRAGPYDGLQPPFSPVVLIERVRQLLRRAVLQFIPDTLGRQAPAAGGHESALPGAP